MEKINSNKRFKVSAPLKKSDGETRFKKGKVKKLLSNCITLSLLFAGQLLSAQSAPGTEEGFYCAGDMTESSLYGSWGFFKKTLLSPPFSL